MEIRAFKMIAIAAFFACLSKIVQAAGVPSSLLDDDVSADWSAWSSCSTTCGYGTQIRISQAGVEETKLCFLQYCPSFLSWPRLHFSGMMVADVNTLNNVRCNYENAHFTRGGLIKFSQPELQKEAATYVKYKFSRGNWNPLGSGHLYFENMTVTSLCYGPSNCSTTASIVGETVREVNKAQFATIDPDWQANNDIWGLALIIPGVLKGKYRTATCQRPKERFSMKHYHNKGYAYSHLGRYKSKLQNITWYSSYHRHMFKNATELSISLTMDLYNQINQKGRMTGTIGLTSEDDPTEITSSRLMKSKVLTCPAPFFYHMNKGIITIDLSASIRGVLDGRFFVKQLHLGVLVDCRFPFRYRVDVCHNAVPTTSGQMMYMMSNLSTFYLDEAGSWYSIQGGVIDVDVSHESVFVRNLLLDHRVAIAKRQKDNDDEAYRIIAEEFVNGINIGVFDEVMLRFNLGQTFTYSTFASQFGKPLRNANLGIEIVPYKSDSICPFDGCNRTLSYPPDVLRIRRQQMDDISGKVPYTITVVKKPMNRGCGLDGQLYVMRVSLSYQVGKRTFFYSSTYSSGNSENSDTKNVYVPVVVLAIRVFDEIEVKECPTWFDVKDIFLQYYNLYPVMWRNKIIDMSSYHEVKKKAKILKAAMFETDFDDSRYMPASRDLSLSKQKMIWNWMRCGMKFEKEEEQAATCDPEYVKGEIEKLKALLERVIMLELSTIPPYFTAWLSLKTKDGRNYEVAHLIKTIFNEEMLHLSLASNLLNSIGGTVNLTDMLLLPSYPMQLASGSFFNLIPNTLVSVERFSISLVRDIFAKIEIPATVKEREELFLYAKIWKMFSKDSRYPLTPKMTQFLKEYEHYFPHNKKINQSVWFGGHKGKESRGQQLEDTWFIVNHFARQTLRPSAIEVDSVGGLYNHVLGQMAYLESCTKTDYLSGLTDGNNTIFVGDPRKQLNSSDWYAPAKNSDLEETVALLDTEMAQEQLEITGGGLSFMVKKTEVPKRPKNSNVSAPLFPVTDLRSAIQAVIEIVYEGEGGSPCSAFRQSKMGKHLSYGNSHYAKFLEISEGRKLRPTPLTQINGQKCLNLTIHNCPNALGPDEAYCFTGDVIPFAEDGVWPIISNPSSSHMYLPGTDSSYLNHQFNLQYTRILTCLERVFGGERALMKDCVSNMYNMIIVGKRLVATPIGRRTETYQDLLADCQNCHATPTWEFVRDDDYTAGYGLDA